MLFATAAAQTFGGVADLIGDNRKEIAKRKYERQFANQMTNQNLSMNQMDIANLNRAAYGGFQPPAIANVPGYNQYLLSRSGIYPTVPSSFGGGGSLIIGTAAPSLEGPTKSKSTNKKAYGGQFDTGLVSFNEGGSHEENPNEGIQQGIGANNKPNLVEEGETK